MPEYGQQTQQQLLLLLLLTILFIASVVNGQIPRLCADNVTVGLKTCCPTLPGQYERCGGRTRGECRQIKVFHETVNPIFHVDDRFEWPIRFFTHICHCLGNYFGTACEECKYGWEGVNCDQAKIYVRRNVLSYTKDEKRVFRDIISFSQGTPSSYLLLLEKDSLHSDPLYKPTLIPVSVHEYFAAVHHYASRPTLFNDPLQCLEYGYLDYNHGVSGFILWHRYFTMLWEKELRKIAWREFGVKDFAMPYWDWIDNNYCEACTNDLMGASGKPMPHGRRRLSQFSQFANFSEYCEPPQSKQRCVGCHSLPKFQPLNRHWDANYFPTTKELKYIMTKKKFYVLNEGSEQCLSFHKAFEGFCGENVGSPEASYLWMHNRVHNMVTGSFCCAATAANDPLFTVHHSQTDRILQAWFSIYKPGVDQLPTHGVKPGQTRESNMVGFYPTIRNMDVFKDTRTLGYTYDNFKFGKHGLDYGEYE